ncbi:MAG: glucose-1-phosphate adenylyltransferase [Clostridia bacterium]
MLSRRKECVAMLLAGGQGTRLGALTEETAKPAVPFGAKYRIIDFPISNTVNSGIDTIGVLTQYKPFELNQYIGNGQPWDLDRINGGAFILPPYQRGKTGEWYKGTANAIYQNISFIDSYDPDYVLILSGDHIYKMDYSKMLDKHKENKADCTIAVRNVPIEEASRFGIMNTRGNNEIFEFEEKPEKPKSTKASMGIYIFSWGKLRQYLIQDEENKNSSNDFGKNIIPMMLKDKQKLYAYEFDSYWKDVGTISSLWEANMDILNADSGINLNDKKWKIYSRNMAEPPQFVGDDAEVVHAMISEGCYVNGKVTNSIIYHGSTIEKGAEIKDSIIMSNTMIGANARISHAIIGWDCEVGENSVIGAPQKAPINGEWQIAVVGPKIKLERNSVLKEGEMLGGKINE